MYSGNEKKRRVSLWKIVKWLLPAVFLAWTICLVLGYTAVIRLNKSTSATPLTAGKSMKKGAILDVLQGLNMDEGGWSAYLLVSKEDLDKLPKGVPKRRVLRITDPRTLRSMKVSWRMRVAGAGNAPLTSSIVITENGKVRWESGIDLGSKEGLQSKAFGRIEPVQPGILRQLLKHFEPVYSPLVILR